jgi:hypothetical protein
MPARKRASVPPHGALRRPNFPVLKTIKMLTSELEVRDCTAHQWEEAILAGYDVWRVIRAQRGGTVRVDLVERSIEVVQ